MDGGGGHPKARFNNVLFFLQNLNQNMPYIALFKKKSKNLGALGLRPQIELCSKTHIYCLCSKTFKVRNSNVSTFILFKVSTIE